MSLARIDSLMSWGRHHGAHLHEQVEAYDDPQYGISLRVRPSQQTIHSASHSGQSPHERQSLPPNSHVVSCPFSLSLSYLNTLNKFPDLQSHSPQFPALFFEILEPHVIGHFFLIQQYLSIDVSHWGPYIRSLPQPAESEKLGTPLYFTDSDMAWIRGTNLVAAREERERTWKSDWERGRQILDASHGWEHWKGKWTWDHYKWAATIFSSRSFISTLIPEEVLKMPVVDRTTSIDHTFPVLFPLIDLANHSSAARVTWFTNVVNEPKDVSIIVDSEIPYGNQIFNNYAPKGNTELLLGYGFCIPGNDEVAIAFKPLAEELVAIRKQHLACLGSHGTDSKQNVFHVRASAYNRPLDDTRLVEFGSFEDGCVDALAVLTANRREQQYMDLHPHRCPERSSEAVFLGPLSRNILKVMSVLLEKLEMVLEEMISTGEHLGIPTTSCQHAAKIYRDGQVSVLQATTSLLHPRLDAAMSQHTICNHLHESHLDDSRFVDMRLSVELVTLRCAFSWLEVTHPTVYKHSTKVIATELEVLASPDLEWTELLAGGWDYTLWCIWIYLALLLRFLEKTENPPLNNVTNWIEQMLGVYNPDGTFSGWPFQMFHGDRDEDETLSLIANQISLCIYPDTSKIQLIGDIDDANHKLMNFASTLATEEAFMVKAEMDNGTGKERVHQRVLFMAKFPDWDATVVEERLSNLNHHTRH